MQYTYSQYSIKSKQTRYIKFEFEKGSRDSNESKETSSQLKPVRNSYAAIMHQPVTVSSNIQQNAYTNKALYSLVHLQDLIPTLECVITYILHQGLNFVDALENALFVHGFGYMVKVTVTGWCIRAIHGYFRLIEADYWFPYSLL